MTFDLDMFIGEDGAGNVILHTGFARYFNEPGWVFGVECIGQAAFAISEFNADIVSKLCPASMKTDHYKFMADVHYFVPVPELQALPHGVIPYFLAGGVVTKPDKGAATWDMPLQFFSMGQNDVGNVVVRANIPDTPRWRNKDKVMPSNQSTVTQHGPLAEFVLHDQSNRLSRIDMMIKEVCFMPRSGAQSLSRTASGTNGSPNKSLQTPTKVGPRPTRASTGGGAVQHNSPSGLAQKQPRTERSDSDD